ncbi:hypothetical protein ON010_g15251 [Phytophthora cinnamomi]|nr:hypothetical protein ON010_g15251 [Phytophthora cinnamomi]
MAPNGSLPPTVRPPFPPTRLRKGPNKRCMENRNNLPCCSDARISPGAVGRSVQKPRTAMVSVANHATAPAAEGSNSSDPDPA